MFSQKSIKLTEEELISGCKRKDRKAQKALYDAHSYQLMGLCRRYCNSREDAEDVLQEGFMNIFESLHQYKGHGQLKAWMRRVIINTALQRIRKRKKEPIFSSLDVVNPQLKLADHQESWPETYKYETILEAIQNLPLGYRLVFNLYVVDGLSHREIAQKLDISEGTSKSQLYKAKAYLKQSLLKTKLNIVR